MSLRDALAEGSGSAPPRGSRGGTLFRLVSAGYSYPDGHEALRDVSLAILQGESVVVLGANGCGKSTLLWVLAGLRFVTTGSVEAFGEPLTEAALRDEGAARMFRQRVGLVFQNADAQLFSPTVRDELVFGPLHLGLPPAEIHRRVEDVARLLGLGRVLDRSPYHLSGGEKRRAAIGAVLTSNPQVLLLDEPSAGLDPRSRHQIVELLIRLRRAGKTIVTSTHDLEIAEAIGSRAVVLSEDHVVAADRPIAAVLDDLELLRSVNLVHDHWHRHGDAAHAHDHAHVGEHEHDHHSDA